MPSAVSGRSILTIDAQAISGQILICCYVEFTVFDSDIPFGLLSVHRSLLFLFGSNHIALLLNLGVMLYKALMLMSTLLNQWNDVDPTINSQYHLWFFQGLLTIDGLPAWSNHRSRTPTRFHPINCVSISTATATATDMIEAWQQVSNGCFRGLFGAPKIVSSI